MLPPNMGGVMAMFIRSAIVIVAAYLYDLLYAVLSHRQVVDLFCRCKKIRPGSTLTDHDGSAMMQVSKSLSCPFCCIRVLRGSRQLARCCLTNRFTIFIGRTGRHEPDKLTLLFLELLPACNSLTCRRAGRPKAWLRYAYTMD